MILAPVPKQFVDQCGVPYRDGSVEVFLNGDTRRAVLYTDSEGTTEAENPSILDSHGSWKAFVDPDVSLDYVVKDEFGNVIFEYYGVKAGTFDGVPHDSTLVGAGTRTRPLGINTSIISGLQEQIDSHVQNYNNPHQVTAHQVGAYTQQETEDRINDALSGEVGSWLGNLTVAQVNALTTHRKGDSATMLDGGTVNPGSVSVQQGDDIMWVDALDVWQKKIDAGLKIMPPADSGTNTMVFYKGVLHG